MKKKKPGVSLMEGKSEQAEGETGLRKDCTGKKTHLENHRYMHAHVSGL